MQRQNFPNFCSFPGCNLTLFKITAGGCTVLASTSRDSKIVLLSLSYISDDKNHQLEISKCTEHIRPF